MTTTASTTVFVAPVLPFGVATATYIPQNIVGEMFYDELAGEMKVYTGTTWIKVSALGQLNDQEKEDMLCEQHPGLKELRHLRDTLHTEEATEKFEAYKALVMEHTCL